MNIRRRNFTLHNPRRGSALVLAIVFTAIMAIVAIFAYKSTMFQTRMAARSDNYLSALAVAEAGAELAMVELNKTAGATPAQWSGWTSNGLIHTLAAQSIADGANLIGQATVTVDETNANNPVITANGFVPNFTAPKLSRSVQIVAQDNTVPSPFGGFGLFAYDKLLFLGGAIVNSYDSEDGSMNTGVANIGSMGDIQFEVLARLYGNAQAGGRFITAVHDIVNGLGGLLGGLIGIPIYIPLVEVVNGEAIEGIPPTPPPPMPVPEYEPEHNGQNNNDQIEVENLLGLTLDVPLGDIKSVVGINRMTMRPGVYDLTGMNFVGIDQINIVGNDQDEDNEITIYVDNFNMVGVNALNISGSPKVTIISDNFNSVGLGAFHVGDGSELRIISDSVLMGGVGGISIADDSKAVVFAKDSFLFMGAALPILGLPSLNGGGKPSNLQIFSEGTFGFLGAGQINAGVYAPNADVLIGGLFGVKGAVIANNITLLGLASVVVDEGIARPQGGDGVFVNSWQEIQPGT